MNFPAGLLADGWLVAAWAGLAVILLVEVRRERWSALAEPGVLNRWLGSIVVLMLLWRLQAGFKPGLSLHFLGAMVMVLAFGRGLAIAGLSFVLAALTVNGSFDAASYAGNALLLAVLPAFFADGWRRAVRRWLPPQVFVYIFANAFFGGGITVFATGAAGLAVLALAGAYAPVFLLEEYLPFFLLLAFAEAWLSGMVVTLMVVYRPHWVSTFDPPREGSSR